MYIRAVLSFAPKGQRSRRAKILARRSEESVRVLSYRSKDPLVLHHRKQAKRRDELLRAAP